MEHSTLCPYCGFSSNGTRFCANCGASLNLEAPTLTPVEKLIEDDARTVITPSPQAEQYQSASDVVTLPGSPLAQHWQSFGGEQKAGLIAVGSVGALGILGGLTALIGGEPLGLIINSPSACCGVAE